MNFELHDRFREEKIAKKKEQFIRDLFKPRGEQSAREMWRVIPIELWLLIFTFVKQSSLTSQVCRGWYGISRKWMKMIGEERKDYFNRYEPDRNQQKWFLDTLVACNVSKYNIIRRAALSGDEKFINFAVNVTKYTRKEIKKNICEFMELVLESPPSFLTWLMKNVTMSLGDISNLMIHYKPAMDCFINFINSDHQKGNALMHILCMYHSCSETKRLIYECNLTLGNSFIPYFKNSYHNKEILEEYILVKNVGIKLQEPRKFIESVFHEYNKSTVSYLIELYNKKFE